jgi:hypothetical protein
MLVYLQKIAIIFMNIYQKLFIWSCVCWVSLQGTQAQIAFSVHGNAALPLFNWRENYKPAIGGGGRFGYNFTDGFALRITGDYLIADSQETRLTQVSKFPLHVLGEWNFKVNKFLFFVGAGAGITWHRTITIGFREKKSLFSTQAVGGVNYNLSERTFLQFNSRFLWDNDSPMQTFSLGFGAKL